MSNRKWSPGSPLTPSAPERPLVFECDISRNGRSAVWCRLRGELDLASAPELTRALRESAAGARLIVIDLRGLAFMDCTGLRAIVAAHASARRGGARLVLIRGPAQVERLLELTGFAQRLHGIDLERHAQLRTRTAGRPSRVASHGRDLAGAPPSLGMLGEAPDRREQREPPLRTQAAVPPM